MKTCKIKSVVTPAAALVLLAFWCTDTRGLFPCFLAGCAAHELGHIAAMILLGSRPGHIRMTELGLVIDYTCALSHAGDVLVALAGPFFNMLFAAILSPLAAKGILPERAFMYSGVNIVLALFNLLPALPMDGGQALRSILFLSLSRERAETISDTFTFAVSMAMFAAGLYIFIKTRYNITMLALSGLMIGGLYAKRFRKCSSKGTETRTLRRR